MLCLQHFKKVITSWGESFLLSHFSTINDVLEWNLYDKNIGRKKDKAESIQLFLFDFPLNLYFIVFRFCLFFYTMEYF